MAHLMSISPHSRAEIGLPWPGCRRGAKALITSSSRVLLVKETHADSQAFWTLPGGGANPDERITDCIRRELSEELRCKPLIGEEVTKFVYAHESSPDRVSVYTVLSCTMLDKFEPARCEGILDARWFRPQQLPPKTIPQVRHLIKSVFR